MPENTAARQEALRLIAHARETGAERLDLSGLRIRVLPQEIEQLGHLRELNLSGCWELRSLRGLEALAGLRVLSLARCSRLRGLDELASLSGLQSLNLRECDQLSDVSVLSGLSELQSLNLSGCEQLRDVSVLSSLSELQSLNLRRCRQLSDVSVLSCLSGLQSLNLSGCRQLSDVSVLSSLSGLQSLDLSGCWPLSDVSVLSSLRGLQSLDLSGCGQLSDVSMLSSLSGLQSLDLSECDQLSDVSLLSSLSGLQSLSLSMCDQISDVSVLSGLKGLQSLNLSCCTQLGDVSSLAGLSKLKILDLSWCPQLTDVSVLSGLYGLRSLDLSGCDQLNDVSLLAGLSGLQSLNLRECHQLREVSVLSGFSELQSLDLSWCYQLEDMSVLSSLSELRSLNLSCCFSQLGDVNMLSRLEKLQSLDLSECDQLSDVSGLSGLSGLRSLDLSECVQLSNVSGLSGLSELRSLDLSGCSQLNRSVLEQWVSGMYRLHRLTFSDAKGVPAELTARDQPYKNCLPGLVDWLDDLEASGPLKHDEIKILVLGNGRAGKTQIVRRLCGETFDPTIASTHGIEVGHFQVLEADEEEQQPAILARVWDFGGQDVYLGTHRLFLDDRAVYLLVWSDITENNHTVPDGPDGCLTVQNRPLAYWLAYIRSLAGPDAPVIVVQTQCDRERDVRDAPVPTAHGFTRLQRTACSAKRADGLERLWPELRAAVRYQRERMDDVLLPASWLHVRDTLRTRKHQGEKVLALADYRRLCEQAPTVLAPDTLLHYLHASGDVFWRSGVFDSQLVLDQAWALEGVYALTQRGAVLPFLRRHQGHFSLEDLNDLLWQNRFGPAEQALFIELMKQCSVCFEVAPGRYIAPDCLPERDQVAAKEQKEWRGLQADAHLRLHYDFLHDGTMRGLLSAVGTKAGPDAVYWRYGCCVADGQNGVSLRVHCTLLPVAGGTGQPGWIDLEASGPKAVELLKHLRASMQQSHWGGGEPRAEWLKGAEQPGCLAHEAPEHVEKPSARHEQNQPFAQVPRAQPAREPQCPLVYVSYAWGGDSGRLVEVLQQRMPTEVDFRRDRTAMKTGDSIRRFEQEIGRAPHVVVVLSAKYLKSVDCVRELTLLYQASQAEGQDFAARIIPVVLDDAAIRSQRERIACARHWKDEKEALERDVAELGVASVGQTTVRELQDITAFQSYLVDSLTWLADQVMPRGFAALEGENFEPVLELLRRRLGLAG